MVKFIDITNFQFQDQKIVYLTNRRNLIRINKMEKFDSNAVQRNFSTPMNKKNDHVEIFRDNRIISNGLALYWRCLYAFSAAFISHAIYLFVCLLALHIAFYNSICARMCLQSLRKPRNQRRRRKKHQRNYFAKRVREKHTDIKVKQSRSSIEDASNRDRASQYL